MLVAAWTVHRTKGFYVMTSGWEYTFVIAVAAVCVAMLGAGRISIDQVVFGGNPAEGWAGLAVAAGLGILGGVGQLLLFYRPAKIETVA
jgi:putative oxidoreductase